MVTSSDSRGLGAGRDRRRGWRRATAAVALLALAVIVGELFRAGTPLGPLRKPAIYPWAALAALSGAAWAYLRSGRAALPAVASAAALTVYLANGQRIVSGDTKPATLIPYALVRSGTLALDGLVQEPLPAWVERRNGHVWSHYPVAAGILALPVYLPAALGPGRPGALPEAEKLAAALLAAASVGFVLATMLDLGVPAGRALLGAAAYGLASSISSTAAQALWQHGPGALALAAAVWCGLRSRRDPRWAAWAGLCAGLAVSARPTNALAAAPLVAWQLGMGFRVGARALLGAAVPLSLLAWYDTVAFGAPWATGYGSLSSSFGVHLAAGLAGVLFSPSRGLVTFVPWTPLAIAGLALGARKHALHPWALLGAGGIVVVHALWNDWAGGWCFGPRLVSDATPLLALGLVPLLAGARRPVALAALLVGAGLGAWLSWLAAFRPEAPLASDVYLGSGAHAMEWWRYPPLRAARDLSGR